MQITLNQELENLRKEKEMVDRKIQEMKAKSSELNNRLRDALGKQEKSKKCKEDCRVKIEKVTKFMEESHKSLDQNKNFKKPLMPNQADVKVEVKDVEKPNPDIDNEIKRKLGR